MKIALAEIISHRHLLSPREAATLTLAVGREWDRTRARHGDRPLPNLTHIELSDAGEISFAEPPADAPVSGEVTLSALLGQLLGLDEPQAPRQDIPGGLLITVAGRLGPLKLPSSQEDGFRSALLRFADDDPGVLMAVCTRVAKARDTAGNETTGNLKVRRGPERRRQGPAVATLRRAVREFERQAFEAKTMSSRTNRVTPARRVPSVRQVAGALAVAGAALMIAAAGFRSDAVSRPTPTSEQHMTQVRTETPQVRPSANATVRAPSSRPKVRAAKTPRPISAAAQARPRRSPATQPHTVFAGGTRAITWNMTAR